MPIPSPHRSAPPDQILIPSSDITFKPSDSENNPAFFNMKYFSIVAAFTSMVAISSAAAVEKRADVSVYLCNDRNFTGYCKVIKSPSGVCVPLASDFDNLVSSVGPDPGVLCYFFVNANCNSNGGAFHYGNPGVADLSRTPVNGPAGSTRNYEDQISSYQCFTS